MFMHLSAPQLGSSPHTRGANACKASAAAATDGTLIRPPAASLGANRRLNFCSAGIRSLASTAIPLHRRARCVQARQISGRLVVQAAREGAAAMEGQPPVNEATLQLADDAIAWATMNGLLVLLGSEEVPTAAVHAPFALRPLAYPVGPFEAAAAAMPAFNLLMDRVASDEAYLRETLAAAAEHDEFTARLLRVLDESAEARSAPRPPGQQQVVLAINRSDYMLDQPSGRFLQVEMNTIASSFGALSTKVAALHRYLAERQQHQGTSAAAGTAVGPAAGAAGAAAAAAGAAAGSGRLPENTALTEICDGMAAAARATGLPGSAVVLFVVQPGERNLFDQQLLQQGLWQRHKLRTVRCTLAQLHERGEVDAEGVLTYDGDLVSVAYLRSGYSPSDYPGDAEWAARLLLETATRCACCPSVAYQLAGAKKVQQHLAGPGVLQRFVGEEQAALLSGFFAGLWSLDDLDDPTTAAIVSDAIFNPAAYVLKPQREGGGNNLYGEAMAQRLSQGGPGLKAYILMQRIVPPENKSVMVRRGQVSELNTLSELGVFGVLLRTTGGGGGAGDDGGGGSSSSSSLLINKAAGHLVRTKASTSDEGGVAAGYSVLDSPLLV